MVPKKEEAFGLSRNRPLQFQEGPATIHGTLIEGAIGVTLCMLVPPRDGRGLIDSEGFTLGREKISRPLFLVLASQSLQGSV